MSAQGVRAVIEVVAGLVPGKADEDWTRRFVITSQEWDDAGALDGREQDEEQRINRMMLLATKAAQADEYARLLRNPGRFNWVKTEWLWL
jgi:hypothetical protein